MRPEVLATQGFGLPNLPKDSPLIFHDATLQDYKIYHVKDEYYPGIISYNGSTVSGQIVYNLTQENVKSLDDYEGDEYERETLSVFDNHLKQYVSAQCYIWVDDVTRLIEYDGRKY